MDEYIKREDAMKALEEYRLSQTMSKHGEMELLMEYRDGVVGAMNALAFVPTADVVEVVRCKDCKHWCIQEGNDINQSYFCSRDKMWCMPTRKADDFCSYGERKE